MNSGVNRILRKVLVVFGSLVFLVYLYVTVSLLIVHKTNNVPFSYENAGTDLTFQSSDGMWRGEEDLLRGRDFRRVVIEFHLYKIKCSKQDVKLIRTKDKKDPWQWAWWFDRYNSPKWEVPFKPELLVDEDSVQQCHTRESTSSEIRLAEALAHDFIADLK